MDARVSGELPSGRGGEPVRAPGAPSVATALEPLLAKLFRNGAPVRFDFWDGSSIGAETAPRAIVRSPEALRRLLWAPGELGIARAFVAGELDFDGDSPSVLRALDDGRAQRLPPAPEVLASSLAAVRGLRRRAAGTRWLSPPPPPAAEIRLSPWRSGSLHSARRDSAAVRHHYDVGNDFYRVVLGPSMTYSCARFETPEATLEEAQRSKHELICRKLGLGRDADKRLLDVGCGWGGMVLHAATTCGVRAVGVTLSPAQADLARKTVAEAGMTDLVDIRIGDYRQLAGERFDAISSIGMFEHVGERRMAEYFSTLFSLLSPQGRLLNHAISRPGGSRMRGRTFMNRYVFPDGELIDVADVVGAMERAGLEVRDVESLREHYATTLRHWVANLESNWETAVALVGPERARVWRLYMAASVNGFEDGRIAVHQVLGVKPDAGRASGMPPTRREWG